MMSWYPVPQLMQCVSTVPKGLWGIGRHNRGYAGATVRVRRSSDAAELDCKSQADIVTHCTGANGFCVTAYDQSSNGNDLTQATTANQPKLFDSSTGLLKFGSTPILSFDGTNDVLARGDICGIATGSPDLTTIALFGTWTNTGVTAWSTGPDSGASGLDCWYSGHGASTTIFANYRGAFRTFNCTDPASAPSYFVYQKASGANANAITCRQNKSSLSENAVTAGAQNLSSSAAQTRMGAAVTGLQWAACTFAIHAHYNANLTSTVLDALEQYLERMRVQ